MLRVWKALVARIRKKASSQSLRKATNRLAKAANVKARHTGRPSADYARTVAQVAAKLRKQRRTIRRLQSEAE